MKPTVRKSLATIVRKIAKGLLADAVLEEVRKFRFYDKNERPIYLKLRISNVTALRNRKLSRPPKTARKFLFVCFGNIIRSPMCEALMLRDLRQLGNEQFTVMSAGLHASPGRPAHPWAIAAADELGISLQQHGARLLTREMVEQADAVFVMDYQNLVQLLSRWPGARSKVFMLSAYAGPEYPSAEIADPYYLGEGATRRCYQILTTCMRTLALENFDSKA